MIISYHIIIIHKQQTSEPSQSLKFEQTTETNLR